ncbi:MAG: hypothetical protein ABL977_08515 [Candidatus Eisenbacteria bacterium]
MLRAESGDWRTGGRHPLEIAAFVQTTARNLLISRWRKDRRVAPWPDHWRAMPSEYRGDLDGAHSSAHDPSTELEAREFASALARCAACLQPRARLAWFLRVFHDLPSREIAAHPQIAIGVPHLNVVLQRAREAVLKCMTLKGFEWHAMPPGTFTHLWTLLHPAPFGSKRGDSDA